MGSERIPDIFIPVMENNYIDDCLITTFKCLTHLKPISD